VGVGRGADISLTGFHLLWDKIILQNLQAVADQGGHLKGSFPYKRTAYRGYTVLKLQFPFPCKKAVQMNVHAARKYCDALKAQNTQFSPAAHNSGPFGSGDFPQRSHLPTQSSRELFPQTGPLPPVA
jgi:hypothetical protein